MKQLFLLLAMVPTTLYSTVIPKLVKVDAAQQKCLATTIYGEARSEPEKGQIAVAYTLLNRAKNKSICDVALAHKQYSIFNNNPTLRAVATSLHLLPNQKNIIDQKSWAMAVKVAQIVMYGLSPDPTHGATHYVADKVMKLKGYKYPKWTKQYKMMVAINNHKFYKIS